MVRSDIIKGLVDGNPDLDSSIIAQAVDAFFGTVSAQLVAGGRVELRGFGTFFTSARDGKIGKNPRDGRPVAVSAKRVPRFRPGRVLAKRVDPSLQRLGI